MTLRESATPIPEILSLTTESFTYGLEVLAKIDSDLARILETLGSPPRWERESGFPTLLRIILEQQVSLAAAKAVFNRLAGVVISLTPENFIKLGDVQLQEIGFSRQKMRYCRELADAILTGQLDLAQLETMDETAIRTELKLIKGIGDWTVDIYLLMALKRPDVFPKGDLGIAIALQNIKGLPTRPTPAQIEVMAQNWRPWRAVATRILWHYYLSNAKKKSVTVDL
ncbi:MULTISPECIES: DNA-3-methyladenine glycosylase 2 family protein [unclassified Nodularia (in: cyanobacteria)]|uniref:DNA-3-methyladenine glycosylase family protein n=1 Tax=unclassified Nodularia (in: cyanobacteria) TaxID=2656917 RepID=UPI0018803019|nr:MULTISPECIES: DNA-3-methyladenine glycosylase 2 family protein [unclassified Nodularia (in: cyanobacteria)]MBE9199182.1 DNA-3-methyladenine glycosylase 2 family protein [Nodularia sp. LEGE 06071]MCC2694122.1 DNA-3-methyladenine glycosylase 2 family protein [Nodularia sp. LEGE 04288]